MSLQEEIQLIVARIDEDHINHADEAALLINKVLDAVVSAVDGYFYDLPRCIDNTDAIEFGSEVIAVIRELR